MANINRDYLVIADLKNGKITSPTMSFYNTDKNIANLFVKLQITMSTNPNITGFVSKEEANDYNVKLTVIKPKTTMLVELEGVIQDNSVVGNGAVYLFDMPKNFTDQVGSYICELEITCMVNGREEIVTCDPFKYVVKGSAVTGLNAEIEANPDVEILRELINEVKSLAELPPESEDTILGNYQKKTDENLITTDKSIVGAINELKTNGGNIEGHTHNNKITLDKITDEKISSWDGKAEGSHNHDTVYAKKSEIPVVDVTKQYVDSELSKKSPLHEHPYLPNTTKIPTKVSELTNDSKFTTETYVKNEIANAQLGSGEVDLSGYATKEDLKVKADKSELNNKVDKVEGRGLSTNDLTNVLKANYDSAYTHSQASHAPSNAGVNVQSDWNESDTSSDAYIKNKPTIPSAYVLPIASETVLGGVKVGTGLSITSGVLSVNGGGTADSVDWNNIQNKPSVFTPDTHSHSYNDLTNKPTIPTVDVTKKYVDDELAKKSPIHEHPYKSNSYMPDWDEIQNKPSTFTPSTHEHSQYASSTAIPLKVSQLTNDSNFATETFVTTKVSEASKGTLVNVAVSWGVLTLTTDKYQTTSMSDGTEIRLPSTSDFVEVHLFFTTTYALVLTMPSCKWQSGTAPSIEGNKTYELIFTKLPSGWLGGCVVYE